jgi:hypothetical protein
VQQLSCLIILAKVIYAIVRGSMVVYVFNVLRWVVSKGIKHKIHRKTKQVFNLPYPKLVAAGSPKIHYLVFDALFVTPLQVSFLLIFQVTLLSVRGECLAQI